MCVSLVCACVFLSVFVTECVCLSMFVLLLTRVCVCAWFCLGVFVRERERGACVSVFVSWCVSVRMSACVCLCVSLCVCVYVCMCNVYVYLCMWISLICLSSKRYYECNYEEYL